MRRTPEDLSPRQRRALGRLIWAFIRAGWNPPTPSESVAERLLEDMGRSGHAVTGTRRDKVIPANATLELGPRERECIVLIADGLTFAEIGAQLGISSETAKMHAGKAYGKLGARNAAHAVALWLRREAGIRRAA